MKVCISVLTAMPFCRWLASTHGSEGLRLKAGISLTKEVGYSAVSKVESHHSRTLPELGPNNLVHRC